MSCPAYVVHSLPGRSRLRLPAQRDNAAYFDQLTAHLCALPGVSRVSTNPHTASLLLEHTVPLAQLAEVAQARGWFTLASAAPAAGAVAHQMAAHVNWLDDLLGYVSAGQWNLRALVALFFITAAATQIGRGQILAPATSMLWYALQILYPPITATTGSATDHGNRPES